MSALDHKAKALEHLSGWDTEGDWKGEVAAAQVHATLAVAEQTAALVEQQRIANKLRAAELMVEKPWLRAEIERLGLS